jgi:cytochrome c553
MRLTITTLALGAFVLSAPAHADNRAAAWAAVCANCHGTDGRSVGVMPTLAGLDRDYLIKQMDDFRSGKRVATIMHQIAKGLSDDQTAAIATYFAGRGK